MTPRKFFIGRGVVFAALLVIGLGVFAYKALVSPAADAPEPHSAQNAVPPVFAWRFEKAESFNLDGFPETDVFLEARYADGTVNRMLVDTTPGSCNETPDAKDGAVQCYSAGLGYRFKIAEGERAYLVQRKTFEEALPGYVPPPYAYETIAEVPF